MSKRGHISPREKVYKQLRANAHKEQTTFRRFVSSNIPTDIPRVRWEESYPGYYQPGGFAGRKKPTLADSAKSDKFATAPDFGNVARLNHHVKPRDFDVEALSASLYDEERYEGYHDDDSLVEDFIPDDPSWNDEPLMFSLEDFPTFASKPKGIQREEYEVVDKVPSVLVLDDSVMDASMSHEDWRTSGHP